MPHTDEYFIDLDLLRYSDDGTIDTAKTGDLFVEILRNLGASWEECDMVAGSVISESQRILEKEARR